MSRNAPPDVGRKIKSLRTQEKLTLDQLAQRSGISKSMLSQIERGLTNPTLATLWGLTQSLGIDIATLLEDSTAGAPEDPAIDLMRSHQTPEIQSADGKCTLRILGPIGLVAKTEWYDMRLEANGMLESEGHGSGTVEHLTVLDGELTIRVGADEQNLATGDTARYDADKPHFIENKGQSSARAVMMVMTP